MRMDPRISTALLASFVALCLVPGAVSQVEPSATARVPFDFFVGNERLPQGEYNVTVTSAGILNFYNNKTGAGAQTFTGRFGDGVAAKDARIVFVRYKEQYRFVGLRGVSGTWRVTVNYFTTMPEGATRHEIPIAYAERN